VSSLAEQREHLNSACRLAGCKVNHLHPVTGAPPDYHWQACNPPQPRWRDPYKGAPNPKDWYYRVAEIAKIAGVTEWSVRRWVKECGLPAHRPPGTRIIRILGREFEEWLRKNERIALVPPPREVK